MAVSAFPGGGLFGQFFRFGPVVGVYDVEIAFAVEFTRRPSQNAPECSGCEQYASFLAVQHNDVGGCFHNDAVVVSRLGALRFCEDMLRDVTGDTDDRDDASLGVDFGLAMGIDDQLGALDAARATAMGKGQTCPDCNIDLFAERLRIIRFDAIEQPLTVRCLRTGLESEHPEKSGRPGHVVVGHANAPIADMCGALVPEVWF